MKSLSILFLSTALFAVGCDESSDSDPSNVEPPPIPASDVEFIDSLVPHHQEALEMSNMILERGSDPAVLEMAREMRDAQQREIAEMMSIRSQLAPGYELRVMTDPHGEEDHAELAAASGSQADVVFLENMIPHHAGAVSLAHRAKRNLTVPALLEMADMTVVMQTREMNEMLDMLGR
ncbi:MAG: DUF305 domain-containing protein [Kofleriaceae bacterium]